MELAGMGGGELSRGRGCFPSPRGKEACLLIFKCGKSLIPLQKRVANLQFFGETFQLTECIQVGREGQASYPAWSRMPFREGPLGPGPPQAWGSAWTEGCWREVDPPKLHLSGGRLDSPELPGDLD